MCIGNILFHSLNSKIVRSTRSRSCSSKVFFFQRFGIMTILLLTTLETGINVIEWPTLQYCAMSAFGGDALQRNAMLHKSSFIRVDDNKSPSNIPFAAINESYQNLLNLNSITITVINIIKANILQS